MGIVVDEVEAQSSPCKCYEYAPGKFICWSKGIVGALSDAQEGMFCNPRILLGESPAIERRYKNFTSIAEACKGKPIGEFLDCMSMSSKKVEV